MTISSPFPGMDPWMERRWGDAHHTLIIYARDQLQSQLPPDLIAQVQERVILEYPADDPGSIYPDVRVAEDRGGIALAAPVAVTTTEPLRVPLDEPETQGFIEIVDAETRRRVVTVIEFLSPSNKVPGPGQELYRRKQRDLAAGGVNLVEVGLVREGHRVLNIPAQRTPVSCRTPYQVCVRRGWKWEMELYRVPLREPLPTIRVPLRPRDADVALALQPLLEQCYRNGRYDRLDYKSDPDPPLDAGDAARADELLRAKGLR